MTEQNSDSSSYKMITKIVFIAALIMCFLVLSSVLFPALLLSHFGSIQNNVNAFEFGNNSIILIIVNLFLFSLGYAYHKKTPISLFNGIERIRKFEISKKIAVCSAIVILLIYVGFATPELFLNEHEQWGDYDILIDSLKVFPSTDTDDVFLNEQNSRFVRMILLGASQDYLSNIKIIPFVSSILVLIFTALVATQFSHKRIAGILSMILLLQTFTFLEYDTIAVYENIWVLFFLLSIYAIKKQWYLSGFWYVLSVFTKAFSTPFLLLSVYHVFLTNNNKRYRFKILISYAIALITVLILFVGGDSIYDEFINPDFNRFANSLSDFSSQMRFDYVILFTILPVIVGLYFLATNGVKSANSLLFFIFFLLLAGPLVSFVTDLYVILPYRFIPLLCFFSIAISLLIFKKN